MLLVLVLETNEYYSKFGSAVELMTVSLMLLLSVLLSLHNWGKDLEEVDDAVEEFIVVLFSIGHSVNFKWLVVMRVFSVDETL